MLVPIMLAPDEPSESPPPTSIWTTPHVDNTDPAFQQYQLARKASVRSQPCRSTCSSDTFTTVTSHSSYTTSSEALSFPNVRAPIGHSLRLLYKEGHTYTLTPQVEEILGYVSRIGSLINRYKISLGHDSEGFWLESDEEEALGKAKDRERKGDVRLLNEVMEEGQKLMLALYSILDPLNSSVKKQQFHQVTLPSLTDSYFWVGAYEDRLMKVLEWDEAARMTILDQVPRQYLPIYHSIWELLLLELPTVSALESLIHDVPTRFKILEMLKCAQTVGGRIQSYANSGFQLTKTLSGGIRNCMLSLQHQSERELGVNLRSLCFDEAIQEVNEFASPSNTAVASQRTSANNLTDEATIILHTITCIIHHLRQLRLSDDCQIEALPTSYLIFKKEQAPVHNEKCTPDDPSSIRTSITSLTHLTTRLRQYRPLHNHLPAKCLLPYFLEIAAYTRGSVLTHADKLLCGFIMQKEMILTAKWEQTRLIGVAQKEQQLSGKVSNGEKLATIDRGSSSSSKASLLSGTEDHRPAFEHKFSFALVPLVKPDSKPDLPTMETSKAVIPEVGPEFIKDLTLGISPPQKLWPVSSFAVTARGVISKTAEGKLVYSASLNDKDQQPSPLDENYSLDEVLKFYHVVGVEDSKPQSGVFGSSVATRSSKRASENEQSTELKKETSRTTMTVESKDLRRTTSLERKKKRVADLVRRLRRFSPSETLITPNEDPSEVPDHGASLGKAETYDDDEFEIAEKIAAITKCWSLRREYRDALRSLSEMKAEVRCAFEAVTVIESFEQRGNKERNQAFPCGVKDRESNWRDLRRMEF